MTAVLDALTTPLAPRSLWPALHPWRGRPDRGVIEAIAPTGRHAATLTIRPGRPGPAHRPGQFVTLSLALRGVRHTRTYSISSAPGAPGGRFDITVQAAPPRPGGDPDASVSRHLVRHAAAGDVVELTAPAGEFVLPQGPTPPLLFLTAGSGLTPVMAMVRAMAAGTVDPGPGVVLLHHATTPERVLFGTELHDLAERWQWLHLVTTYTRDTSGRPLGDRRLSADRLDELCPDWSTRLAYACGPAPLLDFATAHWAAHGRPDRLHLEHFALGVADPTVAGDPRTGDASVRFATSGRTADQADAPTLLDLAESAGVCPPFGCRMGICHTCSTPLVSGQVKDLRDGRVHQAGSHVQLCVGRALGPVVLDA